MIAPQLIGRAVRQLPATRHMLALSLSMTTALVACGTVEPEFPEPGPLVATLTLTPSVNDSGQTVDIVVTVENTSAALVAYVGSSSCIIIFEVMQADTLVIHFPQVCTADVVRIPLNGGESLTRQLRWSANVPLGTYGLRGVTIFREPTVYGVRSPLVTLEVRAPVR